jgi:predicted nucleic acid-binding protein
VLLEVADAMAGAASRQAFLSLLKIVRADPKATVIPADRKYFDMGVALYAQRKDKDWSLTDCISFVMMQELDITEALTADHHFEQAGFVALLK